MFLSAELFLSIFAVILFINQIVIILEKEKLEKEVLIAFKIAHKKSLTREEQKYVRKLGR